MTKREQVLANITHDVATSGKATKDSIRLYVENRISRAAFDAAVKRGLAHRATCTNIDCACKRAA